MTMSFDAIILAAGKSSRMSNNKLTYIMDSSPLILHTIKAFEAFIDIKNIYVVTDDKNIINFLKTNRRITFINGGATRTQSVHNALKECPNDYVIIHDGARPFVSPHLIEKIMTATKKHNSAVPIIKISDSLRIVDQNQIKGYPNREDFYFIQTPQGFNKKQLLLAYNQVENNSYTDDSEVYGKFVSPPFTVEGERKNKKITYDIDLLGINAKVGVGYDIHKLSKGIPLVLGGEIIPFEKGLEAHSDGDVILHAIMDSLLGAASADDIGYHFPPSDKSYKNISSMILLKKVNDICQKKGVKINNISLTIIAQQPKLWPFIPKMRENIAKTLKISKEKINIAATTTEGLGEIGQENAIACIAVCSCF